MVIADNFCNSSRDVIARIGKITGAEPAWQEGDVRDQVFLDRIFRGAPIDAVIHFAGLKAVGESCEKPLEYHDNNVAGSIALFRAMERAGCRKIVFSSSATVYRQDNVPPFDEGASLGTTNPYGTSKLVTEFLLKDLGRNAGWKAVCLRYFNPIGAHPSGLIGEAPRGVPNNLLPYLMDVAAGRREKVSVFGTDYPTPDGSGVRDFIHVEDLVEAHVKAVGYIFGQPNAFFEAVNV